MGPYQPYQPYAAQQTGRPQSMALAAMLSGRGSMGNPMDARRLAQRRWQAIAAMLMGGQR